MSAIDLLHAANPTPPPDAAVGRSPISYLNQLPAAAVHIASTAGYPIGAPLTRAELRNICLDPAVTPLAKYACIMAWGGRNFQNFNLSINPQNLPFLQRLILALLASANNRQIDFAATQAAAAGIPGLGISFYTKLLFFLRPVQDAYILDQFSAKSILLLQFPPVIRLLRRSEGYNQATPNTTPAEYERFCQAVEDLRMVLWPAYPAATAEQVEMAMFDRSRPDGLWRGFVRINFKHPVAGNLVANGGESLTQAHDYRCGLLVIRRIDPPRLFVIGIHGSCCHWSSDDCYRLLLARLRELLAQHKLPITLVLPPGPCPQWFTDALQALGITVETSEVENTDISAGADPAEDPEAEAVESEQDSSSQSRTGNPCAKCTLGREIITAHRASFGGQALPPIPNDCSHPDPHRLVCLDRDGIAWQYNINDSSIRIDCWLHEDAAGKYQDVQQGLSVPPNAHDFGNGILGNGGKEGKTRSISKSTRQGASADHTTFPRIAQEAVSNMSQIFTLVSPHL
jgi:hypothetical protein